MFAVHDPDLDYERRPRQGWATLVHTWPLVRELLVTAHGFAGSRSSKTRGRTAPTVVPDATGAGEEDGDG